LRIADCGLQENQACLESALIVTSAINRRLQN
jgi:hypothetical protein